MKNSKVTLLCLIFSFVVACCADDKISNISGKDNEEVTEKVAITIPVSPSHNDSSTTVPTSTASPTSSTSVPTSSSTSVKPTSPTTIPTTTASPPITTSPPSSTVPPSPTSTPSTTTPPSTSVKPTPPTTPAPTEEVWIVSNTTTGKNCILMKSKIVLLVSYIGNATNNQTNTTEITPSKVHVSGSCGGNSSSQNLVLTWNQLSTQDETSNITFVFHKGTTNDCEYYISNVTANVFVNVTVNDTIVPKPLELSFSGKEFLAHNGKSYTCAAPSGLKLSGNNNSSGELRLSSLHYEAFANKSDTTFSSGVDCVAHETPDIVPILVAGALILLVVLVLAAYVITRRRSQARGYLSM